MRTPIRERSVPASIVTLLVAIGCTKSPPSTTSSSPRSSAVVVPVAAVSAASTPAEPGVRVELHADGSVTVDGVAVTGDAIRDAFRNKPGDEVAVIQAGSDADWGRVIHVLDQMKQAGDRPFVLAVTGDRLKTTTMRFPKAGAVAPPPPTPPRPGEHVSEIRPMVAVHIGRDGAIAVDGSPLAGSLRKRLKEAIARQDGEVRVIILADAQARFALVVEASRDAQAEGGLIAFGVQAPPRAAAPPEERAR